MSNIRKKIVATTVVIAAMASLAGPASAARCSKGAIADGLCRLGVFPRPVANTLDFVHEKLKKPLDRLNPFARR